MAAREAQRPNLMGNLSGSIVLGRLDIKRPPSNTLQSELVNSLGMKLVLIPAGEFLMGSSPTEIEDYATRDAAFSKSEADDEQPQHQVKISRPFYMGSTEVTRGQFAEFVNARNYKTEAESDGKGGVGLMRQAESLRRMPITRGAIRVLARRILTQW